MKYTAGISALCLCNKRVSFVSVCVWVGEAGGSRGARYSLISFYKLMT